MSSFRKILLTFFAVAGLLPSCTKSEKSGGDAEVNLAIWANYLSEDARARFTKETGIKLNITQYSSNEELLAKIQSGATGLDVAVPTDYMVEVLIKLKLLDPLDKSKIPNFAHLEHGVLDQEFDRGNVYSVPYAVGITGIAYRKDAGLGKVSSWKDLLENPKLNGHFALLDDVRDVAGVLMIMDGHSVNSTDPKDLAEVQDQLLKIRANVKMFTSDTVDILKNKEVAAAQAFSSDALQASALTNGEIQFVIPSEGSTRALDNLVILASSPHKEAAHKLLNFLSGEQNSLELAKSIKFRPLVEGVRAKLPADLKDNAILFPPADVWAKLQLVHDLGEKNHLYEDLWTRVKSSH